MKKYITYILLACLLLSCFAGCKQTEVTPTDVTPTEVQEEVVQNDAIIEEASQQVETIEPQQTNKQQQTISQATKKEDNEQPAQNSAVQQPPANGDVNNGYMADVLVEHPTFTTEAALQNWLKGGRSDYFPDDRTQMMGTLATKSTVTYRRPAIAANTAQSGYKLERISTYPRGNAIYFHYRSTTNPEEVLNVLPQNEGFYNPNFDTIDIFVEGVAQNKEWYYSSVVDGITFYYKYIPSSKKLSFIWEQFGKVMEAGCKTVELDKTTVHQKAQQLIPLIKIEQVTINLNSDHVTQ